MSPAEKVLYKVELGYFFFYFSISQTKVVLTPGDDYMEKVRNFHKENYHRAYKYYSKYGWVHCVGFFTYHPRTLSVPHVLVQIIFEIVVLQIPQPS